jgi:hypothetical protein
MINSVNETNEFQILHSEIVEYSSLQSREYGSFKELILRAAQKLADSGLFPKSEISKKLKKIFKDHERYVEKTLPDEYKDLSKKRENLFEAKEDYEKYLVTMSDAHYIYGDVAYEVFKKIKKDNNIAKILFTDNEFWRTSSAKIIEATNNFLIHALDLKKKIDEREYLHTWQKIMLRMDMQIKSLNETAKSVDQTAKWMKVIARDPKITETLVRLKKCPACHFNIAEWFNKAEIRRKMGLEIKMPTTIDILQILVDDYGKDQLCKKIQELEENN